MKVPTLARTQVATPSGVRAASQLRADPDAFGAGLVRSLQQAGAVLTEKKKETEAFDVSRRYIQETTDIQQDFQQRQTDAPLGADGFSKQVLGDYTARHQAILDEMRKEGMSEDAIKEMDTRLAGLRNNILSQSLRFQDDSYKQKVSSDMDGVATNLTQIAASNPYEVNSVLEELNDTVDEIPNLDAVSKQKLKDANANSVKIAAGMGLAAQEPGEVVRLLHGDGSTGGGTYRDAVRSHESGRKGNAENPRSTARGYYQFLDSTWAGLVKRVPGLRMDGRGDRQQEELAMDQFEADNVAALTRAGVPITEANKYAAHFLGPGDASKVLRSHPDTPLASILPAATMSANPHLQGKTVQWFEQWTQRVVGGAAATKPFDGKTGNAVLDNLNAGQRAQVLSAAQTALNQNQVQQRGIVGNTLGNAEAAYLNTGDYAGEVPSREQVIGAYGPIEGEQRWAQLDVAREVGSAIKGMKTQSSAEIAATLGTLAPTDTASSNYAGEATGFEVAQRAANEVLKQRQSDPAGYVMKSYPAVAAAWADPQRRQGAFVLMNQAYEQLGIPQLDRKPIPDAALASIKSEYAVGSPEAKVNMLASLQNQMGPLFGNGLKQIAESGMPTEAYLAGMIADAPQTAQVAANVLRGLDMIEKDKSLKPDYGLVNAAFTSAVGTAQLSLNPQRSQSINESATALYVFNGGDPKVIDTNLYNAALRQVVGGSADNTDTGIVNFAQGQVSDPTILPAGVTGDAFTLWKDGNVDSDYLDLSTTGEVPVYGTGQPASAADIMNDGVFVQVGPGQYMIKMASDGRPLMTASGNRYIARILAEDVK